MFNITLRYMELNADDYQNWPALQDDLSSGITLFKEKNYRYANVYFFSVLNTVTSYLTHSKDLSLLRLAGDLNFNIARCYQELRMHSYANYYAINAKRRYADMHYYYTKKENNYPITPVEAYGNLFSELPVLLEETWENTSVLDEHHDLNQPLNPPAFFENPTHKRTHDGFVKVDILSKTFNTEWDIRKALSNYMLVKTQPENLDPALFLLGRLTFKHLSPNYDDKQSYRQYDLLRTLIMNDSIMIDCFTGDFYLIKDKTKFKTQKDMMIPKPAVWQGKSINRYMNFFDFAQEQRNLGSYYKTIIIKVH